jgi:uncharacterized membrane protein
LIVLSTFAAVSAGIAIIALGAMAGLFFAFSISVMPGLDAIKADQAIPAMQSINQKIQNAVFLPVFIFAPIAPAVTGVFLLIHGQKTAGIIFLLAAAIYVLGAFVPTVAVNIPMNDDLDAAQVPTSAQEAALLWSDYSSRWTRWNHLRAVTSSVSLLITSLGIFVWGRQG